MTRNRFVLLAAGVVVVAFAVGLALGLSTGSSSGGTTGNPPSSSPTGSPVPLGLPASVFRDCSATDTGLTCQPVVAGVDQVLVVSWPDAAAMAADFAKNQGAKPDGKCGSYTGTPATGLRSTWGDGKPLACYVNNKGAAVVLWEVPDRALELLAIRKDGDTRAAFAWWDQAIKTPL